VTTFSRPSGARPDGGRSTALALRPPLAARPFRFRARGSAPRALLVAVGVLAALLALAQVLLPRFAEHQARAALGAQADGVHVEIRATPAIKLLWHRADSVKISVDHLRPNASGGGSTGEMLAGLKVAPKLDLQIRDLQAHGVHLRGVRVHKDGDRLAANADVDLRSLEGVLPAGLHVRPLSAPSGQIRLEGTLSPLGMPIRARAALLADGGRIVVRPEGLPFGSLVTVPVFSDDRISVDGLGARPSADGVVLSARAHLRDA
jgi:hypothetical protein